LPRRASDDADLVEAIAAASPTATVADLLERTDHLLHQLELDIAALREDQAKERGRIERESEQRQAQAAEAVERLQRLALRAREIAVSKGRSAALEAAIDQPMQLDESVTFDQLVRRIEEEVRLAKGISGAIRIETIGALLKQASLRVKHLNARAERARQRFLDETEKELRSEGKEARASYEIGMSVVRRDLRALDLALPPSGLPWEDDRWSRWEDWDPLGGISRWVRYGTFFRPELARFRFPALAEMPGGAGIAIDVATGSREVAIDAARAAVLRVLASIPAGKARVTFIDPTGLGESAAPFLPLAAYRDDLLDGGVCTQEGQIEERLGEINAHIEQVIQQHLRDEHHSIDELHDALGEIIEPYRFVVVFDFPNQLSDRSRQLLRTIIETGPRCGVTTIITTAPGSARANGAKWRSMLSGLDVVVGDGDGYHHESPVAGRWSVELDSIEPLRAPGEDGEPSALERMLTSLGERARQESDAAVDLDRLFDLLARAQGAPARDDLPVTDAPIDAGDSATWWSGGTARGIGVPLGRSGREVATVWLDSAARAHAVVGGEAGSGVSMVLRTMTAGLAMLYPPDELGLYLVDLSRRGGAGWESCAVNALPHARVIATGADREFGVSVLDGLVREMTRRAMLFAPHGGERAGIEGYRSESGDVLPRLVVIIDEVERLFDSDDRIGDEAAQLLDTLVRGGGPYGIHLIASCHSMGRLHRVGRHTFEQVRVRVGLACPGAEAIELLGSTFDPAGPHGEVLADPGGALVGTFGTAELTPVVTACVDDHELEVTLRDARRLATARGFTRPPQVFDGGAAARLEESAIRQLAQNPGMRAERLQPRLWLGEPTALGSAVEMTLRRAAGANLLIVGAAERHGQGLLCAALVSAALGHGPTLDVRVLDLMPLETGFAEVVSALGAAVPVQLARRRQRDDLLGGVLGEIDLRLATENFRAAPMLVVVNGLGAGPVGALEAGHTAGAAGDLSPEDVANPGIDPVGALERIVREGPEVGVHAIVWTDRLSSLAQHVSRATMREFSSRVVMQMAADDSALLIDSTTASTLGEHQALLYDEDSSRLTRFRPYLLPAPDFVQTLVRTSALAPAPQAEARRERSSTPPSGKAARVAAGSAPVGS
jgi:hypothetical protein